MYENPYNGFKRIPGLKIYKENYEKTLCLGSLGTTEYTVSRDLKLVSTEKNPLLGIEWDITDIENIQKLIKYRPENIRDAGPYSDMET